MREEILQTIWQHQLYDKKDLRTVSGLPLTIVDQGELNKNAGPDFSEARVSMDGLEWFGAVEIHRHSSDWKAHNHDVDPAYNTTILHVVWSQDTEVKREDSTYPPTLELSTRVTPQVLDGARVLINNVSKMSCELSLDKVPRSIIESTFSQALRKRLELKSKSIISIMEKEGLSILEVYYRLLAKTLGGKVNADAMEELSRRVPLGLLKTCQQDGLTPEEVLFWVSGLPKPGSERQPKVPEVKSYQPPPAKMNLSWWRLSRMRPAGAPSNRIGQLGALVGIITQEHIARVLAGNIGAVVKDYKSAFQQEATAGLGEAALKSLIINAVIGLRQVQSELNGVRPGDSIPGLLRNLRPEQNNITKYWQQFGVIAQHAFDSQAMIQLWNTDCAKKNCLYCPIGKHLTGN